MYFRYSNTHYLFEQLYIALIRGPKVGKSFMARSAYQPHTKTMAQIHGIRNITLGAIATVSILVSSWLLISVLEHVTELKF
jgi:hypothetical protein